MKRLIYYPTFEPQDIEWLKYALIYIDNFSPIIPNTGKENISDRFKSIIESTDLVNVHQPTYDQGDRASTKTLIEVENILRFPNQYRDKLNVINIEKELKKVENWDYEIFQEKFNSDFSHEMVNREFAVRTNKGIRTSKELGNLFMIFLSEEVAKEEKGNPITDISEFDNLTTYLRNLESHQDIVPDKFLRSVIDLNLPDNIKNIPIERFVEFRNSDEISELRKKLNSSISDFYKTLENGADPYKYLNSIEVDSDEITKQILLFFGGLFSCSLGVSSIIANPLSLESIKEITEGTIMTVSGVTAIKSAWSQNGDKRAARKFLTRLHTA